MLLEKSPPHIVRAREIATHRDPAYFLVMARDPYARSEGPIRRNGWNARRAAHFAVRCLRYQRDNAIGLPKTLAFTYEELVAKPRRVCQKIRSLIPHVGRANYRGQFRIHSVDGFKKRDIVNLNKRKLANLSAAQLSQITTVLRGELELLEYWGYGLR